MKWIAVAFLLSLQAQAKDEAGNGAGIAENNVRFAYENIESYVDFCLISDACQLAVEQREILARIRTALPEEKNHPKQLQFISEVKDGLPGFFLIDGRIKIARTGLAIGSPIFINSDLISSGAISFLTLESATSILVHEFGHHHGELDHSVLDALGAKVGSLLLSKISRADLGPGRRNIQATVIDQDRPDTNSQILVSDGNKQLDLTPAIRERIACPALATGEPQVLKGYSLYGIHWGAKSETSLEFRSDLALYCGESSSPIRDFKLVVSAQAGIDDEGYTRIKKIPLEIHQIACPMNPNEC